MDKIDVKKLLEQEPDFKEVLKNVVWQSFINTKDVHRTITMFYSMWQSGMTEKQITDAVINTNKMNGI